MISYVSPVYYFIVTEIEINENKRNMFKYRGLLGN